jgi:hypothetical protein
MMAARGALKDKKKAATSAGGAAAPTPGARAMQLNKAAWFQLVLEQSKDMVCKNCGFGYLLALYSMRMVPAALHPEQIAGDEGPLPILDFWMCPKCATMHRLTDFRILEKRPDPRTDDPEAPSSTDASSSKREFLGTPCPTCGCEQYRAGGLVSCAQGHEVQNPGQD